VHPRVSTVHGENRVDDYFWLRDRSDPEVIAYLEAENSYTTTAMRHTETLQERLYHEMRARIKEADLSAPEQLDQYHYYSRTEAGGQYPILCRRRGNLEAEEEILLDQNSLAAAHTYFRVGVSAVSPDHKLLAYSVDTTGGEEFTLHIRDLTTGKLLGETVSNTSLGVAWANDSRTLFYTVLDRARRPCRLYRHVLGSSPGTDALVYFEPDESFFLDVNRTRSRRYLLLDIASHSTSEVRFLDADDPEGEFRVVQPREPGIEYSVAIAFSSRPTTALPTSGWYRLRSRAPANPTGRPCYRTGTASSWTAPTLSPTISLYTSARPDCGRSASWTWTQARITSSRSPSPRTPFVRIGIRSSTPHS
jgi:oligopeptidase B